MIFRISLLLLVLASALASSMLVRAQTVFEKLVMPGPLIEGHAKHEKECTTCHEPFVRQSQSRLCLDCHKDIARDRQSKRGFHGKHVIAVGQECRQCHTDHKGRKFDIVRLDRETFDHASTNFLLAGAHITTSCEGCHKANAKFRSAPSRCVDCHRSADRHKGRLGEACEGCHGDLTWKAAKPFDHGKTKFALVGAHKDVGCAACHAGEYYKGLAVTCVSCHQIQDKHGSRRGDKCETCHKPDKWAKVVFNHDKQTKFPLRAKHAQVQCDACHTGSGYRDKPAMTCVSCHRKDDPHKGSLGSKCETCHKETGWRTKVAFDHDVTRFPLVGKHAVVPCEECHRSNDFKNVARTCAECHQDEKHEGRLSANCAQCHNPNAWSRWRFDHTTQTRFQLTGAHQGLQCHACHTTKSATKVTAQSNCVGCHRADDAHKGTFGQACDQCHTTNSFKQRGIRR